MNRRQPPSPDPNRRPARPAAGRPIAGREPARSNQPGRPYAAAPGSAGPRPYAAEPASGQGRKPLTAERLMQIERRKARTRAFFLAIFVMMIMLVTVVLIIKVMQKAKPRPRFIFIQQGELAHTTQSAGLILRDEVIFNAPVSGLLKPMATEGSRAAKGQKLALVIPADKESQLKELQKCEKDIVDLQTELMNNGKGAGAQAIFDESAASLASVVNLVRSDIAKGSLANLSAYSASIAVILEQRTTKLMTIDFNDSRLNTLEQTKSNLEKSLGLASGTLTCAQPGIVSFKLDGLETVLKQDLGLKISAEDYRKYISQAQARLSASTKVTKDQPVLRISSNLSQTLVFLLPNTDATQYKVDDFISINIPAEGQTLANCRVLRSEAVGSDDLLVVRTDRKVEWLSDRRIVQAELTLSTSKGLKVPVSALINHDASAARASLMIVSGGYTRLCQVDVVDYDREYAIIKAIDTEKYKPDVSSILVVNPKSIEAGVFIGND